MVIFLKMWQYLRLDYSLSNGFELLVQKRNHVFVVRIIKKLLWFSYKVKISGEKSNMHFSNLWIAYSP